MAGFGSGKTPHFQATRRGPPNKAGSQSRVFWRAVQDQRCRCLCRCVFVRFAAEVVVVGLQGAIVGREITSQSRVRGRGLVLDVTDGSAGGALDSATAVHGPLPGRAGYLSNAVVGRAAKRRAGWLGKCDPVSAPAGQPGKVCQRSAFRADQFLSERRSGPAGWCCRCCQNSQSAISTTTLRNVSRKWSAFWRSNTIGGRIFSTFAFGPLALISTRLSRNPLTSRDANSAEG